MADNIDTQTDDLETDTNTQVFDPDQKVTASKEDKQPLYRVYANSRIVVGRGMGKHWERKYLASKVAYEAVWKAWHETFKYYNHYQTKELQIEGVGTFKRGDSTENVILSNINILLPAVYSQNPNVTCTTTDKSEEPFCEAMAAVINALFRRKDKLDAKSKVKKQVGMGILTNFGVTRLDWVKKMDSRELAREEMLKLSKELAECADGNEAELIYGKLIALEETIELLDPMGPTLDNVHSLRLICDPLAEKTDGTDGGWMIQRVFLRTSSIIAKYTIPAGDARDPADDQQRVLAYKPTHKASFMEGKGERDEGLGLVLDAINGDDAEGSEQDAQRNAYINLHHTECFLVWDKATRRVMLFHRDDWTWPLWVWDDPLQLSRFFPYFIMGFLMSTGGTMAPGETAYYLDQQDEINQINKQIAKIRRSIFEFFYFNSDVIDQDQAEKFVKALRGDHHGSDSIKLLGVKAGEGGDMSKMIAPFTPPQIQFKEFFSKEQLLATINRITNVNDALRGEQFKTNTTEDAVQTYQESMRISIGAKVDVVEDVMSDLAGALAELCVMNMSAEDVSNLIGPGLAKGWKEMPIEEFRATYDINIVAGSTEKPNSAFKKKEAIQVAQSIGQFAQGAPGAAMTIMLNVLKNAFTEVNIKPEDWAMLQQEISATMNKGNNAPPQGGAGQGGAAPPQQGGGGDPAAMAQAAMSLPPDQKAKIVQMKQEGNSDQEIAQYIQQSVMNTNSGKPAGAVQ